MMSIRDEKKVKILQQTKAYFATLVWRLFVNPATPGVLMDAEDFDECTDGGYVPLSGAAFADAALNLATGRAELLAPMWHTVFDHDGGDFTVYGWYATDPLDGQVVIAERNATPYVVDEPGCCYFVRPKIDGTRIA